MVERTLPPPPPLGSVPAPTRALGNMVERSLPPPPPLVGVPAPTRAELPDFSTIANAVPITPDGAADIRNILNSLVDITRRQESFTRNIAVRMEQQCAEFTARISEFSRTTEDGAGSLRMPATVRSPLPRTTLDFSMIHVSPGTSKQPMRTPDTTTQPVFTPPNNMNVESNLAGTSTSAARTNPTHIGAGGKFQPQAPSFPPPPPPGCEP